MKRVCHILRGNHASETPSECIFLDCETRPRPRAGGGVTHHLWFGWAAYCRRGYGTHWYSPEYFRFETPAQFWGWALAHVRAHGKLYVFAHNCSFDLPVVDAFRELPRRGWTLHRAIIECPPVVLTWRRDGQTITALDTLNWWRTGLAKLGEACGVAKLPMPVASAAADEWDTYCRRDVDVIRTMVIQWITQIATDDLGGFASTLAGQSLRLYRHRYMSAPIFIHNNEHACELERSSYVGGRCEAFFIGKVSQRLHQLDINSMYPAVMRDGMFPTKLRWCRPVGPEFDLEPCLAKGAVIADVDLDTSEPVYGLHRGGRLVFPVGRFRACLTTPELKYALDHGHVIRARTVATYDSASIFQGFVTDMYARRLAYQASGDRLRGYAVKILMNSLYGKFGQRGLVWERTDNCDPDRVTHGIVYDAVTHRVTKVRQFGGITQSYQEESESRDSFPAIAAHVTAAARMKLWGLILQAGRENVYYTDTDSLITNDRGRDNLAGQLSESGLGGLKVEGTVKGAEFRGAKDYSFGHKVRVKGIRSNAEYLGNATYRQERWISLLGQIRAGQVDAPATVPVIKHLDRTYRKGVVGLDGRVSPLVLDEQE